LIFLLDTNISSELRKPKPHGAVVAWFFSQPPSAYAIPSISIYETQVGIEVVRSQNPQKAGEIEAWLDQLVKVSIVLPLDAAAAREAAKLMRGKSLDLLEDAMIAAIAKVNGLTVATRNTGDFKHFGVPHINPFLHPRS
jgi:predicted nucleic acid-binding protein